MKKGKLILVILAIVLLAAAIYGWEEYHRRHPDTAGITAAFTTTAPVLLKAFRDDENKANTLYNDKVINVSGIVVKVERNDSTQTVQLDGQSGMGGIICEFEAMHNSELKALQPGQHVSIKGVCTGMLMDVVLIRCALDDKAR